MSIPSARLQIDIHFVNGTTESYSQDDPASVQNIVDGLQPNRLFIQPHIIISDKQRTVALRNQFITRIDIIMEIAPSWPYLQEALSVHEIPQELFDQRFDPEQYAIARRDAWVHSDQEQIGFTEIRTVDGKTAIWEVRIRSKPMHAADIVPMISSLMNAGGLHAQRQDRGVAIINPANIVQIAFYPGPPEVPPKAWHASSNG